VKGILYLVFVFYLIEPMDHAGAEKLTTDAVDTPGPSRAQIPCSVVEQKFREHILDTVGQAKSDFQQLAACLQDNPTPACDQPKSQILASVWHQRGLLKKVRIEILKTWSESVSRKDLFKNCLNGRPMPSVLSKSSRELSFINKNPICQSLSRSWSHNIDQLEAQALKAGPESSGLDIEEYKYVVNFKQSPLAYTMGADLISRFDLSEEELTQRLRQPLNQLKMSTETIEKFAMDRKSDELYQLYIFKNQFQQFANTLGSGAERAFECRQASTFLKDCFALTTNLRDTLTQTNPTYSWMERKNRCESRKFRGLLKALPIVSVYDAFKTNTVQTSAFFSQVATRKELAESQGKTTYQALVGALFPLAPATKFIQYRLAAPFIKKLASPGLIGATGNRYMVKKMRTLYKFEDFGVGWVRRFPPEKLRNLRVYVKDGKIVRQNGKPVNVEEGMFVMDEYGNILLWNQDRSRAIKHSTLMGGRPVAGSGQTKIENGVISWINNDSGHYHPSKAHLDQVVEELKKRGADFSSDFHVRIETK